MTVRFLMIYTIGIPGEPEANYMRCYQEPMDYPELEHDMMLNVIRDAWAQRHLHKIKPWIDPLDFEKVAKVMDINVTTVDEFLKLPPENNS